MKQLNEKQIVSLSTLANSSLADSLLDYLDFIKKEVCDIRNVLKVKAENEKEIRIALCDLLDEYLISELRVRSGKMEKSEDNYQ